jgi:hypothetical protein
LLNSSGVLGQRLRNAFGLISGRCTVGKRIDKHAPYSPLDGQRIREATRKEVRSDESPRALRETTLRTKVTKVEKRRFLRLVSRLGEALDASISPSHLLRPLMEMVVEAEMRLIDAAGRSGPVYRPPNDRREQLDRFEADIRKLLHEAIADTTSE